MAPRFSVVIPTYNHAEFLKESLRSVLNQTFEDFEVLVVNNHSTDHTLEVVKQMADPRVRLINFENHGVIGASRNVGIKESTGGYVAFLDSDDSWHSNKLERVAKEFEGHSEIGLVCHDQNWIWDDGTIEQSDYGPPSNFRGNLYDYLLIERNCLTPSATTVARAHLEQVGYFSEERSLITVEDYDLWLKLSRVCPFYFIKEELGTQSQRLDSSTNRVELHLRSALSLLDRHFSETCGSGKSVTEKLRSRFNRRKRYAKAFHFAARQCQRQGAAGKTFIHYLEALKTYPLNLRAYGGLALLLADSLLGPTRRKKITNLIWGSSWRWG